MIGTVSIHIRAALLALAVVLVAARARTAPAAEADTLAPLNFLAGHWQAMDTEKSSQATGDCTFSRQLQNRKDAATPVRT